MTITIDTQIEQALSLLDEQIERIKRIEALACDEAPVLIETTTRDALQLYDRISRLTGKRFTPSGNLISQDGVRQRLRDVQARLITLRKMAH